MAPIKAVLPCEEPQQITAISYTKLEAYLADETKMKCIPFFHYLVAFAYLGHNVIVFEGHSSALEFGVKNSDVLMIDSGMLPFLDSEWPKTVFKYMNPDPKIFVYNRESSEFDRVAKKSSSPGWQYTERDGETSYTNMLLTTLARENDKTRIVDILSGSPLPDLKDLTTDIDQFEYISILPYRYDKLNADEIIGIIWENGSPDNFLDKLQSKRTFRVMLAESEGKTRDVSFRLKLSKAKNGKSNLKVQLL